MGTLVLPALLGPLLAVGQTECMGDRYEARLEWWLKRVEVLFNGGWFGVAALSDPGTNCLAAAWST